MRKGASKETAKWERGQKVMSLGHLVSQYHGIPIYFTAKAKDPIDWNKLKTISLRTIEEHIIKGQVCFAKVREEWMR